MKLLFFIILLDLMGIGIFSPVFPYLGKALGAPDAMVTFIYALFPIGTFIAAPFWGRMSDKLGRRPVLIFSQIGAVAAWIMVGLADNLWVLAFARLAGGLMAGNLGAAFAYITDITTPQNRTKGMGMVGAALSLGFIIGPAVGGWLAGDEKSAANFALIAFFCAGMNSLALLGTVFFLPESLSAEARAKIANRPRKSRWEQFGTVRARRGLLLLFLASLIFTTGGSVFETTFALWGMNTLDFGPRQVGILLGFAGVIMVLMQTFVVGRLAKRFGELKLTIFGCVVYAIGLGFVMTSPGTPLVTVPGVITAPIGLFLAQVFLPMGLATFNPSVSSLVSKEAADTERGVVMGLYQSVGSLGRATGPTFSGALFGVGALLPFMYGVMAMAVTVLLVLIVRAKAPAPQQAAAE
jgi:DHA1 family tetracycline resistance protein-like MFS transporter